MTPIYLNPNNFYWDYSNTIKKTADGYYYLPDVRLLLDNCWRISYLNAFNKWFYARSEIRPNVLKLAIARGIQLHKVIELVLKNKETEADDYIANTPDISKPTHKKIQVWRAWWKTEQEKYTLLFNELTLCAGDFTQPDIKNRIAFFGTIDCVLYNKETDTIEIIDWKTSQDDVLSLWKYTSQLAYYRRLLLTNFDVEKKIKIFIVFITKDVKIKKVEI